MHVVTYSRADKKISENAVHLFAGKEAAEAFFKNEVKNMVEFVQLEKAKPALIRDHADEIEDVFIENEHTLYLNEDYFPDALTSSVRIELNEIKVDNSL